METELFIRKSGQRKYLRRSYEKRDGTCVPGSRSRTRSRKDLDTVKELTDKMLDGVSSGSKANKLRWER